MTPAILDHLTRAEFQEEVGFVLPPRAFRRVLLNNPHVRHLSAAIRLGHVSEQAIREFVATQAAQYQPGKPLSGDVGLAALAVALESCPPAFAEEFLCDLARLQLCELATSIRVARECLKARYSLPKNEVRSFIFPAPRVTTGRSLTGVPYRARARRLLRSTRYGGRDLTNAAP